jgi:xanthine dehydrogenase YagS FAD-binding subunit
MKNFKIAEPQNLEQVAALSSLDLESTLLLAGGTDLLGAIKDEIFSPDMLIDLGAIPGLDYVDEDKNGIRIGTMTTVDTIANPGLVQAARSLATPQLRNVGTLGGNLCQRPRCWYFRDAHLSCWKKGGSRCFASGGKNKYHAVFGGGICHIVHPSDLAPALIGLNAEVVIRRGRLEKKYLLENFFILPNQNVRRENILESLDVLKEIRLPLPGQNEKSTYWKFKERETWDFAVVSAAVCGTVSAGIFSEIRIVLGGVAPIPWRLRQAEDRIKNKRPTDSLIQEAVREAMQEAKPLAENGYKLKLVETVLTRAVLSLV